MSAVMPSTEPQGVRGRRVTDSATRLTHGLMALSFALAWLTGDTERWRDVHVLSGYTLAALLLLRLADALWGPRRLSWRQVARQLGDAARWALAAWAQLRAPLPDWMGLARRAQSVALGAITAALLLCLPPLLACGWLGDQDWGPQWLQEALLEGHEALADGALALVGAHLLALLLLSLLRQRNAGAPMLSGRVPGAGPDLVTQPRHGRAVLIGLAVGLLWCWQWPL
ncbi:cytochrome b/b6 domain-containing protein [Roseateles sp. BYS180W]|uniref:Cytochrome b/b6 domain-containing protein n=1 Tax=Roseateles rivi TaxID=3299028 RepID=A0ABW7FTM2_9BURK